MCDLAYALLVEQYDGDGRAVVAAGDERSPSEFRLMVEAALDDDGPTDRRFVSAEERELREALGVA